MEKIDLNTSFANRLKTAMLASGLHSSRSTSGVCIHQLAAITGYSVQICRRYLRGEALPEPAKLVEIARKLQVSPGWLLFGEEDNTKPDEKTSLKINKKLLRYIFLKANALYNSSAKPDEIALFLIELVTDVSKINASEDQSKQIIDLALSSVHYFRD